MVREPTMMGENGVHLHVLKLHESAVVDGNYDRFHMIWLIDDASGPPQMAAEAETCEAKDQDTDTPADRKEDASTNVSEWTGISFGDLLFFPELQSGAGEFEGLRFAGQRSEELTDGNIPLLVPGIESVEFPPDIVYSAEKGGTSLRDMYERPLEKLLSMQGGMSLADLYGGSDVVEEFWAKPDVMRRRTPLTSEKDRWIIPLSGCTLIKSMSFEIGPK
jgi:hypothetical protein